MQPDKPLKGKRNLLLKTQLPSPEKPRAEDAGATSALPHLLANNDIGSANAEKCRSVAWMAFKT